MRLQDQQIRCRVAGAVDPEQYRICRQKGRNRPSPVIITTVTNRAFTVALPLRRPVRDQVRFRHRLAELGAGGGEVATEDRGLFMRHRGVVRGLRRIWAMYSTMARAPRPPALLHQLGGAEIG